MAIKAFRLFVSSTFADFAAERDVLQRQVFPALDAYCTAKGYQFYPLDLRWGVNEEAQLDQRTAEICLNEVRAAKQDYPPPNFLILIGDRYGFVPLPYAIAQDEFEAIRDWLEGRSRHDAARALGSVYQHDSNYLMPRGLAESGAGALSPDGRYIFSRSSDKTLRLWDADSGQELARFERESTFNCFALAPDGKSLSAIDSEGYVHHLEILFDKSDKIVWLRGLAGGGPTKPAVQSATSVREMNTGKPGVDQTRPSALSSFFTALTGKSKS